MSTRSMIGRVTDLGVEGVYHHFDGYPSGLGKYLWEAYHEVFVGDLERMQRILIDEHRAGWSNIIGADWSKEPGFLEYTSPGQAHVHFVGGNPVPNPEYDARPRCYCHGDRSEPPAKLIQCRCATGEHDSCDPLFIEYMYALTTYGLEVWYSIGDPTKGVEEMYRGLDGKMVYGAAARKHDRYGLLPWDDTPNWGAIEDAINTAKERAYVETERLAEEQYGATT